MQTFLPYSNFKESAKVLDWRRLGKQRVEAFQIINLLEKLERNEQVKSKSWVNHPAVKMWQGYTTLLKIYCNTMIEEWISRGYKNTMKIYFIDYNTYIEEPQWLGLQQLHKSHRSNLLRKLPEYYNKYFLFDQPETGYWWPYRRINGQWHCFFNQTT